MSVNWVTVKKFAELSGYSEQAIRRKIERKVWPEDKVWHRAPDRRSLISIEGYNEWVQSAPGSVPTETEFRFDSDTEAMALARRLTSPQPTRT